jgi:hypothetical protein
VASKRPPHRNAAAKTPQPIHTSPGPAQNPHETILDVVEFVDVVHNFLTIFLYKVLDKSISANGNPKANVSVIYKGRGGEQGTEVCEGGMRSEQAMSGRVRLGCRDTLDENLGFIIEVQAIVFTENVLDVRAPRSQRRVALM